MNARVRKVGDAVIVTLPSDALDRYGLMDGDELSIGLEPGGIVLRPAISALERQRELARRIMDENSEALARLAR